MAVINHVFSFLKKGNKNQYAYAHHHIEVDGWYTPTTVAPCQNKEPICLPRHFVC